MTMQLDRQASRGSVTIARRVVEKVAAQAAGEIATAGGRSGGFFGLGSRPDLDTRPQVRVELNGMSASVAIVCGVAYPGSLRDTTAAVRSHVKEQLERLVGVTVSAIDIEVNWLSARDPAADRRLR